MICNRFGIFGRTSVLIVGGLMLMITGYANAGPIIPLAQVIETTKSELFENMHGEEIAPRTYLHSARF